jgi:cytochrome c oxidase cbb3-type subunit 3
MRKKFISRFFILASGLFLLTTTTNAQGLSSLSGSMKNFLYYSVGFVLLAIISTIYLIRLKNKFQREAYLRTGKTKERSRFRKWWSRMDARFFTKAASLEKEADVLLDHDYDGIKELNNALPPWWKWGFYFTIIVAVIYLLRFHVFKTGPTPEDEYKNEMQIASAKMELYRSKNKALFDESNVTVADAAGIIEGKKIFTGTCFPCHGQKGEGGVGPNLTDNYWLHGGGIKDVFKTITYGVPDKGMQAWGKTFSATDVRNLSSFVLSLKGTNPPNAKAPQGDLFEPGKKIDSTVTKRDSVATKPAK